MYLIVVLICVLLVTNVPRLLAICEYLGFVFQSVALLTSRSKCKEMLSEEQFKAEGMLNRR